MKYVVGSDFKLENTAVTLGKFDGVHLGHQLLLKHILDHKELQSVMFTFDLHPGNLFSDQEIKLTCTREEQIEYLDSLGLDVLVAYPFTSETASMEPEDFVKNIICDQLGARLVVVGEDFRFGKKRRGDVNLLKDMATECGYQVITCSKVMYQDQVVSSTRIRELIEIGQMEEVAELLGRPYNIVGPVIHGNYLGHTVGMPTANVRPEETKILPPNGVYVVDFTVDGETYRGITNLGYKPTIGGETVPGTETWIFDFDRDIYGKNVKIEFLSFVRSERKFESLEDVKNQVDKDAKIAKEYIRKSL